MKPPSAWQIGQVLAIAKATADRLADAHPATETDAGELFAALRADGVDAEDILARLVRAVIEAEGNARLLTERMGQLTRRKERFERIAAELRASTHAILSALDRAAFGTAEFSASIRENAGGAVIITDYDALPDEYAEIRKKPNKIKIAADLKAGVVVPGATLSQGGEHILTIRTT